MLRLMHVADLHLSHKADREYGLGVLRELVQKAEALSVDAMLFCGDIFDTFDSAEELRVAFRDIMSTLSCKAYFIPGNHEELGAKGRSLAAFDFGSLHVLANKPFSFLQVETPNGAFELLAIPHQTDLADYRGWEIPEKGALPRLAMAHGLVSGMSYSGPDVEEGGSAIDPDVFVRAKVDYAALGHIHDRRQERRAGTVLSYAGSSRVWRRGECGPKGALLVELDQGFSHSQASSEPKELKVEPLVISAAGCYRYYNIPLLLDGNIPEIIDAEAWAPEDFIELEFSGVVADELAVKRCEDELNERYRARVRRIVMQRDQVAVLAGIAEQPLARRFLGAWEARRPDPLAPDFERRQRLWLRAREVALLQIKQAMESHGEGKRAR